MDILVGISGASGMPYAKALITELKKGGHNVNVVISKGAYTVAKHERVVLPKPDYAEDDLAAPFASGSYKFDAMVIIPCSLKTLGEIAHGIGSTLITRAAEVCLKERRKLILVIRETPLSLVAIENMRLVTLAGGTVMPASPAFYPGPKGIDDVVGFMVGRVMDQLGLEHNLYKRWKGKDG
ncbi:MAG: UbiX family flavin prenyltransferase [Candidatus Micrarchaeota archaeon]|nr:UbiX family flavin prenyltransferase [Candidatus Micrarchaeota archaeon]